MYVTRAREPFVTRGRGAVPGSFSRLGFDRIQGAAFPPHTFDGECADAATTLANTLLSPMTTPAAFTFRGAVTASSHDTPPATHYTSDGCSTPYLHLLYRLHPKQVPPQFARGLVERRDGWLYPVPYTVPAVPCTTHGTRCTTHGTSCTLYHTRCQLYHTRYQVYPVPHTVPAVPCTTHGTSFALCHTQYQLYPVPHTVSAVLHTVPLVPCTTHGTSCTLYHTRY